MKECFFGGKRGYNYYQGQGANDKGRDRGRNVQLAIPSLYLSFLGPLTDSKQKPAGKNSMEKEFSEISFVRPRWGYRRMENRLRGQRESKQVYFASC